MKIGFIGLGAMGRGMAANLQKAGHDLVVYDMRAEAAAEYLDNGATWASSPSATSGRPGRSHRGHSPAPASPPAGATCPIRATGGCRR